MSSLPKGEFYQTHDPIAETVSIFVAGLQIYSILGSNQYEAAVQAWRTSQQTAHGKYSWNVFLPLFFLIYFLA